MAGNRDSCVVRINGPREFAVAGAGFWIGQNRVISLDAVVSLAGIPPHVNGLADSPSQRLPARIVAQRTVPDSLLKVSVLEIDADMGTSLAHEAARFYDGDYEGGLVEGVGFPDAYNASWDNGLATPLREGMFSVDWRGSGSRRGFGGAPAFRGSSDIVIGMIVPRELSGSNQDLIIPANILLDAISDLFDRGSGAVGERSGGTDGVAKEGAVQTASGTPDLPSDTILGETGETQGASAGPGSAGSGGTGGYSFEGAPGRAQRAESGVYPPPGGPASAAGDGPAQARSIEETRASSVGTAVARETSQPSEGEVAAQGGLRIRTHAISDAPSEIDLLQYRDYAAAISRFLQDPNTEHPLVMSIDAPWGMGEDDANADGAPRAGQCRSSFARNQRRKT